MSVKVDLGVLDVAYSDARGKYKRLNGKAGDETTGDVAQIIEDRWHVMETFYEARKDKIADWITEAVADQIEDTLSGARPNRDPFYAAMQNIEAEFRAFLDANEMAHIVAGLTQYEQDYLMSKAGGFTGAASRGVNHRKKKGYNKNRKARPAFIDTGLYRSSFRAFVPGVSVNYEE